MIKSRPFISRPAHNPERPLVINLTRYFGCSITRSPGSDGKMYLSAIVWFPRSRKRRLKRGQKMIDDHSNNVAAGLKEQI